MTIPKLPIRIIKQGGNLKATTSVDTLYDNRKSIRQELGYIEQDYGSLVRVLRELLTSSKSAQKSDPRILWLIGDYLLSFFERLDSLGFYLVKQNETVARDISTSESSIEKILSFRRRFSFISLVDSSIPWSQYRENKVPIKQTQGDKNENKNVRRRFA
ncbi:MAG: hypothetical protein FJ213_05190 [Ignavibacteria bacterium]|nr:hypothetical protein [Ignavibacteria bacterium]